MRRLLLALLLSTPIAAQGQTPRDLARLNWGGAAPAGSVSTAPDAGLAAAGHASAADLVQLSWGREAPRVHSAAPILALTSGATARDLVKLTGAGRGFLTRPVALFAARTARPRG